ncbi:MAG TPA: ABC-F family ATP-binding cassette domain-containing protein [Gemmatimonadaceae bacterium]|nr:ABC-F family ATP-binding cassette domain-containing protein [Gemmatimonadaceae bacterium]
MTQLAVSDATVEFGATTLFRGITFTVAAGERWGIIGRNGTGKTTLFRLLTGEMKPTRGQIARQPGIRISLLEQHRDFGEATTIWEAAAGPFAELLALERSLVEQASQLEHDSSEAALARYGKDLERFEREGGYEIAPRVDAVLHGLGFDPQAARTTPIAHLSGGERGRLGLARQLVSPADVLLLDEPTNHLDLETTRWLEEYLASTPATVLLISHDRAFLAAVVDHVLYFEGDSATSYAGRYESFVEQRALRRLTQQRQFEQQQRKIAGEQDYIARNIAGQNTKQAKGRRKRLERMSRLSPPPTDEATMSVRFEAGERGGDRVVIAERATIAVGDRVLAHDVNATIMRGDTVGLIGPNGSGKSTFIRALMGEHALASGELRVGGGISVGYYRQDLAQVPLDRTLYDVIADLRPTWDRRLVQGHLGRFGFSGDEVQRYADTLSGGERARVALAMLMLSDANFLILDEPTNHLDVESIEALEDAIERYEGTVLLVSHDRELLRALTTRVWVLHDRHITDFDGDFGEWESVAAEREHAAAVRAAEEESLRRVAEKKKTARREDAGRETRNALRAARREVQALEASIETIEARIEEITRILEDAELYTQASGISRASELGSELERQKRELERALEAWGTASERLDTLSATAT